MRPADRVRGLIGSLESGVPDLADQHRAYLTTDRRDFGVYRIKGRRRFEVLPR